MAKIPSYQQGNRLGPGVNQDIVNPGEQRLMGNAVAQFGGAVAQFGGQLDQYYKEKARVDQALYKAEFGEVVAKTAIEAETFARTNPKAARDGSTVQSDFDSVFSPLREQLKQETDRSKRAIGYQVLNKAEAKHKQNLLTYQVEKHNANILESGNMVLNSMSTTVQQDPSTLAENLLKIDELAMQMPFEGTNKESFLLAGRRSLVESALEAYAYSGDLATAKKILNETQAGNFFSLEEKKKLTKEFEERYRQKNTDLYTEETREHTRMKREKEDNNEKFMVNILSNIIADDSPAAQLQMMEDAGQALKDGMITTQAFKAISAEQGRINVEQSMNRKGEYTVQYLKGRPYNQIKNSIVNDMAEGLLRHQDGMVVLSQISQQEKKAQLDPQYKEQKTLAKNYVKSAVAPTGFSALGSFFQIGEKQLLTEITELTLKLEAEGKKPMEAAREATARIVGVQEIRVSNDPQVHKYNDDPVALDTYGREIVRRLNDQKARGSVSPEYSQKVMQTLREIKMRKEHLKQKKILDSILKMEKPTK